MPPFHFVRGGVYAPGFHWVAFLVLVLFLILVASAITLPVLALTRRRHWGQHVGPGSSSRPAEILRERFARGEIDEDEYERKSELLRRSQ